MSTRDVARALENNSVDELVTYAMKETAKRREARIQRGGFISTADLTASKASTPVEEVKPKLTIVTGEYKPAEYAECEIHGEYVSLYSNGDPFQDRAVIECPKCREARELKRKLGGVDGIAKRFTLCNFDNYRTECQEQEFAKEVVQMYADGFDEHFESGRSMLLQGNVGTGKTHLACAVANQIAGKGYTSIFRSVSNLIRSVRETWGGAGSESAVIEVYRNVDLLIIDEVGVQNNTENERNILFDILNSRYEEMKPTILITNLDIERFTKAVGLRIASRVQHDGVIVPFTWGDYRKEGA